MKPQLVTSLPIVYVKPGECYYSTSPELVTTILGSCISIIMYNVERRLSVLSHCVMPSRNKYGNDTDDNDYRYVDTSVQQMLKVFSEKGIAKPMITVKLFGGAEQLAKNKKNTPAVGRQNIMMAMRLLEQEGLKIVSMDVGGNKGRKLYMSSHTGEVLLSRLSGYKIIRPDQLNEKNKSTGSR